MRILCTICARGGSKGVPRKNLRLLAGKPLIAHTIRQARLVPEISRVIVSTDDPRIAKAARAAGADVPFLRPASLARDASPKLPVIRHALRKAESEEKRRYDLIVDLDPTSPLRVPGDVQGAIRTLLRTRRGLVFSVCEARKNPYFNMVELDRRGGPRLCKAPRRRVSRRQDAPKVYEMNASIYVFRRGRLLVGGGLFSGDAGVWIMPPERSVDIDRESDFRFVEFLMSRRARSK